MHCGAPMDRQCICSRIASFMKILSTRVFNEPMSLSSSTAESTPSHTAVRRLARSCRTKRGTDSDSLSLGSIASLSSLEHSWWAQTRCSLAQFWRRWEINLALKNQVVFKIYNIILEKNFCICSSWSSQSTQIWEVWWHGQLDLSQWCFCLPQLGRPLQGQTDSHL